MRGLARFFLVGAILVSMSFSLGCREARSSPAAAPLPQATVVFDLHQRELFAEKGSHTNAWADFDNDGDLDLYVGFGGKPSRPNCLYRNDGGTFTDVAAQVGLADREQTRAVGWGDYDGDGHLDIYVGFSGGSSTGPSFTPNRLYHNDGNGKHFTDVTRSVGLALPAGGKSRQVSWIDYDNDGDVDLYVAFRDRGDHLFRNDGGKFTDVSEVMGVVGTGVSMGAVWFDVDEDGDLDGYLANMDGYPNCLYRNDGTRFVDVARELGLDSGGRAVADKPAYHLPGSMRPDLVDFDNDGDLDIYVTNYSVADGLYRNDGGGRYVNVAGEAGLARESYQCTAAWGDFDNDGWPDVYVYGRLFRNEAKRFRDVTPKLLSDNAGAYGVQWADFDKDGDLDLALSFANHYIFRNQLPAERAQSSLQVLVLDEKGVYRRAGSEVRVYSSDTGKVLGTRVVGTGSGYCSQNVMPVHVGLSRPGPVDVEITVLAPSGRKTARLERVDPGRYVGGALVVRVDAEGHVVTGN